MDHPNEKNKNGFTSGAVTLWTDQPVLTLAEMAISHGFYTP